MRRVSCGFRNEAYRMSRVCIRVRNGLGEGYVGIEGCIGHEG